MGEATTWTFLGRHRQKTIVARNFFISASPQSKEDKNLTFPGGSLTFSLHLTDRSDCRLLPKATYLHINSKCAVKSGGIISDFITGWRWGILGVSLRPHLTKQCTVRADWQTMRKSDIRYPRATTDPGPAEGHIATENIKCQVCGNMQKERLRPTWHYHTSGCCCPERNLRKADRPNWQQCYGYFPWQPVESTGSPGWGGREGSNVMVFLKPKLAIKRF